MNQIIISFCALFLCLTLSCSKINVLSPKITEIVYLEEYSHIGQFTGSDNVILLDSFVSSDLRFSMPVDTSNETLTRVTLRSAVISWDGDVGILESFSFILKVDGESAAFSDIDITTNKEDIHLEMPVDLSGSVLDGLDQMLRENHSVPLTLEIIANNPLESFDILIDLRIRYCIIMSACQEMPPGVDLIPCQL